MNSTPSSADSTPVRAPSIAGRLAWAVLVFAILVLALGAAVIRFAPRVFPTLPVATSPAPAAEPIQPMPQPLTVEAPVISPEITGSIAEIARLNARVETLEARQNRATRSASAALAAAALLDAAQTSRPFSRELAAVTALLPANTDLGTFQALAATGAPSRASLALDFPEYAARAAVAARDPGQGAGVWPRLIAGLSRVVMIRPVGHTTGRTPDALLARAETELSEGDVDLALQTLSGLPPAAGQALDPWRKRAQDRADIDRHTARLRAEALKDLADLNGETK